ncbi:MAG: flagellar hook assembly protein FlgD [Burkholderiales bacterium]|nr:flagellar hook assembly protein FlgD [Burkholderiales bacterium]
MTTTTSATSGINNSVLNTLNGTPTVSDKTTATSDRFLKLLVTQMQNQDPLNPMDNAQVTSQMAQINTVTGIEKLNTTMSGMTDSFGQMQILQGAGLVGHEVLMEGNKLSVNSKADSATGAVTNTAVGGFKLSAAANNVKVEVIDASGKVVDTINDTSMDAGIHSFQWPVPATMAQDGLTFKVTATNGSTVVPSTPLISDTVDAVSNSNGTLNLELRNGGSTAYNKITSVA